MKLHTLYLAILSFVFLSCTGQTTKGVKTIDAVSFSKKIQETESPQILDVRTPEEYASEHIDKAENVNWLGDSFVVLAEKYDKSKPVFVYCKSGGRSQKAAAKLAELGFTNIYELEGGILKWNAAGFAKPLNKAIGITNQEYAELLNSDKKVLIDFYAEWCAPCKKMTPYLLKMQKELAGELVIIRLDADKNKSIISELKISELPALLLYENKKLKWSHTGYISENDLKKQLQ